MNSDAALCELCGHIFRDPSRVNGVYFTNNRPHIQQPLHSHPHLLQLDVAMGYRGEWKSQTGNIPASGTTAAVFYPGIFHGYALSAQRHDAQLFSIKLRVAPEWRAIRSRIFAEVTRGMVGAEALVRALHRACRDCSTHPLPPTQLAALCDVLALWPKRSEKAAQPGGGEDGEFAALRSFVAERLSDPPGVAELAHKLGISPRQLTRQMRARLACSPHEFVTAQRLARARAMLAESELSITRIADALGFLSVHAFSRWFKREARQTPRAFRNSSSLL